MAAEKKSFVPKRVKRAAKALSNISKTFRFRIRTYQPNIKIHEENSRFIIKTVQNGSELMEVLKLRYEVFYSEYVGEISEDGVAGIDVDKFDILFDHLAIIDKKSGKPVGTYRLNCTRFNSKFYSAKEFKMKSIQDLKGHKIELGRACVHPDFRNGVTIAALWKGLGSYMLATDSRYMFGCSSIHAEDTFQIALIHHWLQEYMDVDHADVRPKKKFRDQRLEYTFEKTADERFKPFRDAAGNLVPPLLLSYLKAGGKVCGIPAVDKAFRCYDYFTLIDREKMDKGFVRKFLGKEDQ
jgi:putative hemolysin